MNPYLPLIRLALRIGSVLLLVLCLIILGAWIGHRVTTDYYAPRLDAARAQAAQFQTANTQLRAAVDQQNQAIADILKRAQEREADAVAAQRTAAAAAQSYQQKAAAVLASRPASADECRAAAQAFDTELQQERSSQ